MKKRRQAPAARIASPDVLAERGAEDLKAERSRSRRRSGTVLTLFWTPCSGMPIAWTNPAFGPPA
jgi:hypothetical protein